MMGAVKRMPLQLCMHLAFAGAFLPSARLPSQGTLLLLRGERGGTLREGTLRGRALPCTGPGFSLRRRALPCMQAGDAAAHVAGLNAWLWERGVLVRGGVEVGSCGESGLGLIAIRQIQKGEVVASVPSNVMLQTATALNVPELEKASGLVVGLLNEAWGWGGNGGALELGDVLLAIRLLHEQRLGNASDLAPWIRMLPAADSVQTPLMWGEAEVDRLLGGCLVGDDARELCAAVAANHALLSFGVFERFPEIFPPSAFSLDKFRWGIAMALTRGFPGESIQGLGVSGLVLLPGLDMANHRDSVSEIVGASRDTSSAPPVAELVADRCYAPGEEVHTFYGAKSNAQMLYSFGFTRDDPLHPASAADLLLSFAHLVSSNDVDAYTDSGDGYTQDPPDLAQLKRQTLASGGVGMVWRFRVPAARAALQRGLTGESVAATDASEAETSWASAVAMVRLATLSGPEASRLLDPVRAGAPGALAVAWAVVQLPLGAEAEERARRALSLAVSAQLEKVRRGAAAADGPGTAAVALARGAPGRDAAKERREDLARLARASEAAALQEALSLLQ